ncbi:MAG TPA: hypothetical protein DGG95_06675 [Cytophagales bacterium]|jgi:hypothetical protein|nr:hypothetical protein [Cytophagales bacterium]
MAGVNNITRSIAPKSVFESALSVISSAVSFNQGDLLVFDDTNNLLKKPAAETEGNTFLGVAPVTVVSGKIASPYNTDVVASQAVQDVQGPKFGVVAKLTLKTGITINPGDLIYLDPGTGTDGVTNTGTKAIGVYQGSAITTSAAGTKVEVLLGSRFPEDVLKF